MKNLEEKKKKFKEIMERIKKDKKSYHPPKGKFDETYVRGLYYLEHGHYPKEKL